MTRWLPVCWILIGLTLIGCRSDNAPQEDGGKKVGANKEKPTADVKPDFALNVEGFVKERKADQNATDAKYNTKIIEFIGIVRQVSKWSIWLGGDKDGAAGDEILCLLKLKFGVRGLRLSKGQKIRATGKLTNGFHDFHGRLDECVFVELEPSTIFAVTAEDLVKECEKDERAADQKFAAREMIVSGTFEVAKEMDLRKAGGGFFAKLRYRQNARVNRVPF